LWIFVVIFLLLNVNGKPLFQPLQKKT